LLIPGFISLRRKKMARIEAAIFDLDGTLIPRNSTEKIIVRHFVKNLSFSLSGTLLYLVESARHKDFKSSKAYYHGIKYATFLTAVNKYFSEVSLNEWISERAIHEIERHREEGRKLILLTGAPEEAAVRFGKVLKFDLVVSAKIKVVNGVITGKTEGPYPYGKKKRDILIKLSEYHNIELNNSYGYGDSFADRFFLNIVGNPVAVNPDKKLKRYAVHKGWKIVYWF